MKPPTLSIIIPTHNRAAMLRQHLAALAIQSWPLETIEVIVVADSCVDQTEAAVTSLATETLFSLRLISHQARSAAASRQAGAEAARGEVLIFLDDDIAVDHDFIRAHMEAQQPNRVVLGYSRPVLPARPSRWQVDAYRWWEDSFRAFARPGHRFTYRDFFSGNASLPSELFWRVGGFDLSFSGRLEDYELGMRLIKAGANLHFAPLAIGDHHDQTDLPQWLRRLRQEGIADVQIAQRHPELRSYIFDLRYRPSLVVRLLRLSAFFAPKRGASLEQMILQALAICERFGLRYRWKQLLGALRDYNYYRGVAGELGSRDNYKRWLGQAPSRQRMASEVPMIDLNNLPAGHELAELLAQATAKGVTVMVGETEVFALPPEPGAEPLQIEHLRLALREATRHAFIPGLTLSMARLAYGDRS